MKKNVQNLKSDSRNSTFSIFYFLFSKFFVVLLLSTLYFLFSWPAFAAEVSFDTKTQEIKAGQLFEAGLFLNTEDEDINAVEGKIVFPEKLLELKEIRDGNSIINFWIERPKARNGEILFSGIIPGGYMDKKGLIFSVVFQAPQEGRGSIEIRNIKTLLNDGKGTAAKTRILNFEFRILKSESKIPDSKFQISPDIDVPEAFEPIVTSDPAIFDGKYFLVFAAQDKGSGIDHYEIQENRKQKIENRMWIEAESPYVLQDQKLRSFIYVRVIDKAGNGRIAVVEPRYPIKWYEIWWIWVIIMIIFVGCLIWTRLKKIESRK